MCGYHGAVTKTTMVLYTDEGGQQRLTMEEKVSKMKGLLVKTKKELSESKKNVNITSFVMTSYMMMSSL